MIRYTILTLLLVTSAAGLYSQVEHVPITHPVYNFLLRAETKGYMPHYSMSELPLQRKEVVNALKMADENRDELSSAEIKVLNLYMTEFELLERVNAVVIYSKSDTNQVLSKRFISSDEKFIYHYQDSSHNVNISPLGSIEEIVENNDESGRNVTLGNLGIRLFGTIDNMVGYYLQATNGVIISGDRQLALIDPKIGQNVKFAELGSDFDFSESHVIFQKDWFYASIGRESRLVGSGLDQRLFTSTHAPPYDALSLGVKFKNFEYDFTHGSLLALPSSYFGVGYYAEIPSKYMASHRFALQPAWGEIGFWENVIYSDRPVDLSYLNPLSFFKSLEHANKDRDNSIMGLDATIRPIDGLQVKGTFLLDDIKFGEIGNNWWGNKTAWNLALIAALPGAVDIGCEYSRVEPYTFSHFNPQNSMTNDSLIYGSYILPNSDRSLLRMQWWWGGRYPIRLDISYTRHGSNIYNAQDSLVKNVGGDPLQTRRPRNPDTGFPGDSYRVEFLEGDVTELFQLEVAAGYEIIRGFNIQGLYRLESVDGEVGHVFRLAFRFEDF